MYLMIMKLRTVMPLFKTPDQMSGGSSMSDIVGTAAAGTIVTVLKILEATTDADVTILSYKCLTPMNDIGWIITIDDGDNLIEIG